MRQGIDILFLVHDRAHYIRRTLPKLLNSAPSMARIWIWQNEDHPAVSGLLERYSSHPRVFRIQRSSTNKGLTLPTNWFWREATGSLLGKVDDDCLVSDGWIEALAQAHEGAADLGVVAMWPFPASDFLHDVVTVRGTRLDNERHLIRNCWVGGSGYLMNRECVAVNGFVTKRRSFTRYCIDLCALGYLIGWHYPLILQDHMEDPRSTYCTIRTDRDLLHHRPQAIPLLPEPTIRAWIKQHETLARGVQTASLDPKDHQSPRQRVATAARRLVKQRRIRRHLLNLS